MEFRKAGMEVLALVAEYRKKMIVESGQKDTGIDKELEEYTREKMEDGSLVEWLAEEEGELRKLQLIDEGLRPRRGYGCGAVRLFP